MPDECELSTYDEVIEVITNLRFLVREKRRRDRLSIRAAAEQAGISGYSSVHRFEQGRDVYTATLVALIRWVAGSPATESAATTPEREPIRSLLARSSLGCPNDPQCGHLLSEHAVDDWDGNGDPVNARCPGSPANEGGDQT